MVHIVIERYFSYMSKVIWRFFLSLTVPLRWVISIGTGLRACLKMQVLSSMVKTSQNIDIKVHQQTMLRETISKAPQQLLHERICVINNKIVRTNERKSVKILFWPITPELLDLLKKYFDILLFFLHLHTFVKLCVGFKFKRKWQAKKKKY